VRGGRRPQDAYPALAQHGYAHLLLCAMVHGPRPTPAHEAEHLCGNKLCMNPRHLAWALHKVNCARRTPHGTQTQGEKHGMAKLRECDVRKIRSSGIRGVVLADYFGVSPATISLVRNRKNWRHVTD
jgi:hypothetical protein